MPKNPLTQPAAATPATQNESIQPTAVETVTEPSELETVKEALAEALNEIQGVKDLLAASERANKKLAKQLADLQKEPSSAQLEDMTACVNGKLVKIERTVEAKFATDEVKKGFLDEDLQLLVPKRC
jgi:hypothetical protein